MPESEFTFDKKNHIYYLGGVKIPSVSEIISPFSDYSKIPQDKLKIACNYGTAVHSTIEFYLKGTLDEDNLPEGLKQPLAEFKAFAEKINIADVGYVSEEKRYKIINKRVFAGTVDLISDGMLIDYKTRRYNAVTDDLQLTAYEILAGGEYDKYILELLPNKLYNLVKVANRQAKSMFLYLLDYWWKTNEFNQKVKMWGQR
ncbi:MAG: hypothetical protein ACYC97_05585 [Metallibacterium sp.]